jgi:predicted SnoaL-like aldol condensation-catalyzing enzyme
MTLLTPSRLVAAAALALAALAFIVLGFGVAYAGTDGGATATGIAAPAAAKNKACVRGQGKLDRNKANVVAYYTRAFNDKEPEDAVDKYVGFDKPGEDLDGSGEPHLYIQHNPLAASGAPAFIEFVNSFTAAFPDVHIDIRRVVAECDLVVTHGLLTGAEPVFSALGSKVVDIFRLDEHGKIVEHWDVLAAISPTSANGNPEV